MCTNSSTQDYCLLTALTALSENASSSLVCANSSTQDYYLRFLDRVEQLEKSQLLHPIKNASKQASTMVSAWAASVVDVARTSARPCGDHVR